MQVFQKQKNGSHMISLFRFPFWRYGIIMMIGCNIISCSKSTNQSFLDPRDGQSYKTIRLNDGNIWMSENLAFETATGSFCDKENQIDCKTYGRLYTWEAAKEACPKGWHLPTKEEWDRLILLYGGIGEEAYKKLIKGGSSGFEALLSGGRKKDGIFDDTNNFGYYWSATEEPKYKVVWMYLFSQSISRVSQNGGLKDTAISCRCVAD